MHEIRDPFEPFQLWFRSLSKPVQWVLGVPIIVGGLMRFYADMTYVRQPDEPQLAIWVTLILFVVSVVLSELLRPKANIENARPAGLGDFQFPTATEGRPVPLVWGTVRQKGPNVIWYGDLVQEAITEKIKTGLWSSETITKGFTYSVGVQFALCRGTEATPVTLKKVWIGEDLVASPAVSTVTTFDIDKPELFGGTELGSGGVTATCDYFPGTRTQAKSTWLDQVGRQRITTATTQTCPTYNGTCYVLARELTSAAAVGTEFGALLGTSTTIKPWSFEVQRFPALFGAQTGSEHIVNTNDANPANVVYELLTNNEFGFGFSATDVDLTALRTAGQTLKTEGNGFSMLLDREMSAKELLNELQRQIDGVIFLSQLTGLWTIKLARNDYTIGTVPQLTDSNVAEVRDFTRGSWEDTTNTIKAGFDKRSDDYKKSFALAQDTANALIQGDGTISGAQSTVGSVQFPGVKDADLASNLAWRELRGQSYPLARCTLVVSRDEYYSATNGVMSVGDVVAWTNVALGFVQLPMRITRIDYGTLQANKMSLTVVQDVFEFAAASMGSPAATGWTPPAFTFADYPTAQRLAIECPRGILVRDPNYNGDPTAAKVFAAARRQSNEVIFQIRERHAVSTPAGSYAEAGDVYQLMRIGQLDANLAAGGAVPTSTITLTATPDSQSRLETVFNDAATLQDLGVELAQLVLVNNEFMLVADAANNGSDVDLQNVYRGALDSVQGNHTAGDDVFLVFVGAGVSSTTFPNTDNVDIKLAMRSGDDQIADGSLTAISFQMAKRAIRPYAPTGPIYNSATFTTIGNLYNTPNLEHATSGGENGYTFAVDWWRRAFDTADEVDEMLQDNASVDASTEYLVEVFADGVEIASSVTAGFGWATGSGTISVPRNEIIDKMELDGTNEIRIDITARHDIGSETNLESRYTMSHSVVPTSVWEGLFYLGGNIDTGPSASFVVAAAGVHTVDVAAAPSAGNAEYRINGGAWATITPGGTATASLSISDTIEVRQSSGGATPDANFVWIDNPSAVAVAYGTL